MYRYSSAFVNRSMHFDSSTGRLLNPEQHNLPVGVAAHAEGSAGGVLMHLQIEIDRQHIVRDLLSSLQAAMSRPDTLRLALRFADVNFC